MAYRSMAEIENMYVNSSTYFDVSASFLGALFPLAGLAISYHQSRLILQVPPNCDIPLSALF